MHQGQLKKQPQNSQEGKGLNDEVRSAEKSASLNINVGDIADQISKNIVTVLGKYLNTQDGGGQDQKKCLEAEEPIEPTPIDPIKNQPESAQVNKVASTFLQPLSQAAIDSAISELPQRLKAKGRDCLNLIAKHPDCGISFDEAGDAP